MNYTIDTINKTIIINESVDSEDLIKFLKSYKNYKVISNFNYSSPYIYPYVTPYDPNQPYYYTTSNSNSDSGNNCNCKS